MNENATANKQKITPTIVNPDKIHKLMKTHNPLWKMFAGLAAVTLAFVGAVATVNAAATALNGQVTQRPLTPTEISSLTGIR